MSSKSNETSETNEYEDKFTVFTDGSALNNKQDAPAGYAIYFPSYKKLISNGMRGTNNQAELEAMRYALWYYLNRYINQDIPNNTLYIFSDSEYTINAVSGKNRVKANFPKIEVCKKLIEEIKKRRKIKFIHVMAHTNNKDFVSINNNIVDCAARNEALKIKNEIQSVNSK